MPRKVKSAKPLIYVFCEGGISASSIQRLETIHRGVL